MGMDEAEYLARLAGLWEAVCADAAPGEALASLHHRHQRAEFELTLAYRLGSVLPATRMDALFGIHTQVMAELEPIKTAFMAGRTTPDAFASAMQARVQALHAAYAKVLSAEELEALMGSAQAPTLPLMPDLLRGEGSSPGVVPS